MQEDDYRRYYESRYGKPEESYKKAHKRAIDNAVPKWIVLIPLMLALVLLLLYSLT